MSERSKAVLGRWSVRGPVAGWFVAIASAIGIGSTPAAFADGTCPDALAGAKSVDGTNETCNAFPDALFGRTSAGTLPASIGDRAAAALASLACVSYDGPGYTVESCPNFNTSGSACFPYTEEAWSRDALTRLAYDGDCNNETAAERWQHIDILLGQLDTADRVLGSTVAKSFLGGLITYHRNGELDTGFKDLIPILFKYASRIPNSYAYVVSLLDQKLVPSEGVAPAFTAVDTDGVTVSVPETENHMLLILSERYLVNQLLGKDNTQYTAALKQFMSGIMRTDFMEYNARPYQRYSLDAMQNLYDFSADPSIATLAHMVLDFASAKYAASSSRLRRSSPYRRRGDSDATYFTNADEQLCRWIFYTGQYDAVAANDQLGLNGGAGQAPPCQSLVREIIGNYRPSSLITDLATDKTTPYLQAFAGGPSYYNGLALPAPGDVQGGVEIYDNEGPFLIAAGGVPRANGMQPGFGTFGFKGQTVLYSLDQGDVGIALPTVLIPSDPAGGATVIDREQMIQFRGPGDMTVPISQMTPGHLVQNLCVYPGFACGENLYIPQSVLDASLEHDSFGSWTMLNMGSYYVAALAIAPPGSTATPSRTTTGYAPAGSGPYFDNAVNAGMIEAMPAVSCPWPNTRGCTPWTFADFVNTVLRNNPVIGPTGLPVFTTVSTNRFYPCDVQLDGATCEYPTILQGTYTKVDGTKLTFQVLPSWWPENWATGYTPPPNPCNAPNSGPDCLPPLAGPNAPFTGASLAGPQAWPSDGHTMPPATYPVAASGPDPSSFGSPPSDTSQWPLAAGSFAPMQADHSGRVVISNYHLGTIRSDGSILPVQCVLDATNPDKPTRSAGCDFITIDGSFQNPYTLDFQTGGSTVFQKEEHSCWKETWPNAFASAIAVAPGGTPVVITGGQVYTWAGSVGTGEGQWTQDGALPNGATTIVVDPMTGNFFAADGEGNWSKDSPGGSGNWQSLPGTFTNWSCPSNNTYLSATFQQPNLLTAVPCWSSMLWLSDPQGLELDWGNTGLSEGLAEVVGFGAGTSTQLWSLTVDGNMYGNNGSQWLQQPGGQVGSLTDHYAVGGDGNVYWWDDTAPDYLASQPFPGNWKGPVVGPTLTATKQIAHDPTEYQSPFLAIPAGVQSGLWAIDETSEVEYVGGCL